MDSGHQHFVCDKIGGLSSKNTQGVRVKHRPVELNNGKTVTYDAACLWCYPHSAEG